MFVEKKVDEAVDYLRRGGARNISKALWLASGMAGFSNELSSLTVTPLIKIPHYPRSLAAPRRETLLFGSLAGEDVIIQEGRRFLYEGYFHRELAFPIRVFAALGLRRLLFVTFLLSLRPEDEEGDMVLLKDHIDLTGGSPVKGISPPEGKDYPLDMTEPYSAPLGEEAMRLADESGRRLSPGTAALWTGPEGPTAAEARMLTSFGADFLAPTLAAEVVMARFFGIEVVALGVVTGSWSGKEEGRGAESWNVGHLEFVRAFFAGL